MKLAVVGSINMDMTVTAQRIPGKGETLLGESVSYIPGGKGANQAVAMAKLGAQVEMFGCVGDDSAGERMLANLWEQGVETARIKRIAGVPTGVALITVAENDNTIVVVPGANAKVDVAYVKEIQEQLVQQDIVVLQQEIPLETVYYVVRFCHEHHIPVLLNPAPATSVPADIIEKVTWLTPNEHEAVLIFGKERSVEDILKAYPGKLVITQGSKGVSTWTVQKGMCTVPSRKSNVVDTTGAGDTLNGAFAVRMAAGDSIEEALLYANVAAGLSVEKFGAQSGMPTAAEVEQEMQKAEKE